MSDPSIEIFDLAVVGGRCLTMDPYLTEISDTLILVRGGFIEYIGPQSGYRNQYHAHATISAVNRLILPAFINAHTHLSLSLYRGLGSDLKLHDWLKKVIWPLEKRYCNPENVYLGSCLSLLEMIRSGTGTLADMNFFSAYAAKAIEESGLRGFIGEALFSTPTPSIPDPSDGLAQTEELISRFRGHPRVGTYVVLHAPFTCSGELYLQAYALAKKEGKKVCSHIAETRFEYDQVAERYGASPVEWLDRLGVLDEDFIAVHGVHLSERDREILALRRVSVIHNPHSNMMLGSGICPVPDLIDRGVRVGIGTDSASSNNSLSMLTELQTAAKLHKLNTKDPSVIPASRALKMGTSVNSSILGIERLTGHLFKGMSADFIICSTDSPNMVPMHDPMAQVVYSMDNHDILTLAVGGRIIMKDRHILSLDEELIIKEVQKWAKQENITGYLNHEHGR